VGIPGTGLSYRERLDNPGSSGAGKGGGCLRRSSDSTLVSTR
jgi:hypothetical protein